MNADKYPRRKSTRLKDYAYSEDGAYFVTICTQNRLHLFGHVDEAGQMCHTAAGLMVYRWWDKLAVKFNHVDLDTFIVMPNHIHGIIALSTTGGHAGPPLHDVVGWFKCMTTNAYIHGVKSNDWRPYQGKLWQRSFHDHIIRNETELNKLREYTLYNPSLWAEDRYYSDTNATP